MASVFDVANYFLAQSDEEAGDNISNLKLQKLLYYSQGIHLAAFGDPLFEERIRAWTHGPVVREAYDAYKEYGANGILVKDGDTYDALTQAQQALLDDVYAVYGQFSAWKLRDMTHGEPPWKDTMRDTEITHNRLREYFLTRIDNVE